MTSLVHDLKRQLFTEVEKDYRDEYRELLDTWKQLEGKAQASVGIAGLFLGGILGLASSFTPRTPCYERVLIAIVALALTAAVVLAVFALLIRLIPGAPLGSTMGQQAIDIIAIVTESEVQERKDAFLQSRLNLWRGTVVALQTHNERKAMLVAAGQSLTIVAVVSAGILSMLLIFF